VSNSGEQPKAREANPRSRVRAKGTRTKVRLPKSPPSARLTGRKRPRPRRKRVLAWLGVSLAIVLGLGVGVFWRWLTKPGGGADEWLEVGWPHGLGAPEAAELLADLGLTDGTSSMALYFRLSGASRCFRAGAHLLPKHASPRLLRQLLCADADRPTAKLTIPEGLTRFAIAERLARMGIAARAAFLEQSQDAALLRAIGIEAAAPGQVDSAEGYLFPATYVLPLDSDPAEVLRRLVAETDRRWLELAAKHADGLTDLSQTLGWSRREVLVLASIVEKEAAVAEERPIIASVFLNRLRDPAFTPKYLQSDPTAVYGCFALPAQIPACSGFAGRASPALNVDPANPYSTYVHTKLPPGPIANPGAASVEAVLAPAQTRYLYFVASGDGRHAFSEDFQEHERAVERLRRRRAK
jgi:UPF0755 protein